MSSLEYPVSTPEYAAGGEIADSPKIFTACDVGRCKGGEDFACEEAYTGPTYSAHAP